MAALPSLESLRCFVEVARLLSFRAVADEVLLPGLERFGLSTTAARAELLQLEGI